MLHLTIPTSCLVYIADYTLFSMTLSLNSFNESSGICSKLGSKSYRLFTIGFTKWALRTAHGEDHITKKIDRQFSYCLQFWAELLPSIFFCFSLTFTLCQRLSCWEAASRMHAWRAPPALAPSCCPSPVQVHGFSAFLLPKACTAGISHVVGGCTVNLSLGSATQDNTGCGRHSQWLQHCGNL